jgi:hypothetical protein
MVSLRPRTASSVCRQGRRPDRVDDRRAVDPRSLVRRRSEDLRHRDRRSAETGAGAGGAIGLGERTVPVEPSPGAGHQDGPDRRQWGLEHDRAVGRAGQPGCGRSAAGGRQLHGAAALVGSALGSDGLRRGGPAGAGRRRPGDRGRGWCRDLDQSDVGGGSPVGTQAEYWQDTNFERGKWARVGAERDIALEFLREIGVNRYRPNDDDFLPPGVEVACLMAGIRPRPEHFAGFHLSAPRPAP